MNLQWLYYFNTVAELEHYTRAAEKLHVSQSNLSHAIKELESELGADLFERKGRNVQLTKYGKVFKPYAEKAINSVEAGVKTVREYVDPDVGTIVLIGFQSVAQFATDLMVRYQAESNRLKVQFQYSNELWKVIQRKLLNGTADMALATKFDSPQLSSVYIGTHPLAVLVPSGHPLASRGSVNLEELDGEDFIAFDGESQLRGQLDAIFSRLNIQPNVVAETPNDLIIYGLVAARRGVSIVPHPLAGTPAGTRLLRISNTIPQRELYLQWNTERYVPPAAEVFRSYIIRGGDVFDQYLNQHKIISEFEKGDLDL